MSSLARKLFSIPLPEHWSLSPYTIVSPLADRILPITDEITNEPPAVTCADSIKAAIIEDRRAGVPQADRSHEALFLGQLPTACLHPEEILALVVTLLAPAIGRGAKLWRNPSKKSCWVITGSKPDAVLYWDYCQREGSATFASLLVPMRISGAVQELLDRTTWVKEDAQHVLWLCQGAVRAEEQPSERRQRLMTCIVREKVELGSGYLRMGAPPPTAAPFFAPPPFAAAAFFFPPAYPMSSGYFPCTRCICGHECYA